MNQDKINELAKIIWDYHRLNQNLEKSDCLLVLGSLDLDIAKYGAKLFLDGWAPLLIFSGGYGRVSKDIWTEPEAEQFAKIAISMGVPNDKIIIENKSANTGENIQFTKDLLEKKNINVKKLIVVQKPYMERRAYATFKRVWPEKEVIITSPPVSFDDYSNESRSKDDIIGMIVGDLQRIKIYAERGFQIPQNIPKEVWDALKF